MVEPGPFTDALSASWYTLCRILDTPACCIPESRPRTRQGVHVLFLFILLYLFTDIAPAAQELSERLVMLMLKSRMLDMELVEAERQLAVYCKKFNKDFRQEMLAHPSEIDGVEIVDGDDTSSSSASTKELTIGVRKLMHSLALKVHPDKDPGRDSADFQSLYKADSEEYVSAATWANTHL